MKRNKLFIAGLVTVFVALCSLTLVSSTWAKYTSTASGTDTARVAYWGFKGNDTPVTINLFKNAYENGATPAATTVSSDAKVIAPGTSNSVTVTLLPSDKDQNPEVSYLITFEVTLAGSYTELDKNTNFVWTLKPHGADKAEEYQTLALLEEAIEEMQIAGEPGDPYAGTFELGWSWKFFEDEDGDKADTALGNAASLDSVTITIAATATQVD